MHFFKYTFNKSLRSISTYTTLVCAMILPWTIIAIKEYFLLPVILYFSFPIFIIFIAYRAGQVFRDEIENKTMLTIQTKPITRKRLVWQGYLAMLAWITIAAALIALLPSFVSEIINDGHYLKPFLMWLTSLLLGAIFGSIALILSLLMKGKAFIGIMLGAFGSGFYILFGISSFLQIKYSNRNKGSDITIMSYGDFDQKMTINYSYKNGGYVYNVTKTHEGTSEDVKKMYENIKELDNNKYSVIKWLDPSLHWTSMFGASSEIENDEKNKNVFIDLVFNSEDYSLKSISDIQNDSFTFIIYKKKIMPLWYPYILWSVIGVGLIFLSLKKVEKINIS